MRQRPHRGTMIATSEHILKGPHTDRDGPIRKLDRPHWQCSWDGLWRKRFAGAVNLSLVTLCLFKYVSLQRLWFFRSWQLPVFTVLQSHSNRKSNPSTTCHFIRFPKPLYESGLENLTICHLASTGLCLLATAVVSKVTAGSATSGEIWWAFWGFDFQHLIW